MSEKISAEWLLLFNNLNELQKRCAAAIKAKELGYGGISEVARHTGLSRNTISKGLNDLPKLRNKMESTRQRAIGGGRKKDLSENYQVITAMEKIFEESTAGDPMSHLRWTSKSVRNISNEISSMGHDISRSTVHRMLVEQGYSLQSNRKTLSKKESPDRDKQFHHINDTVSRFMEANLPVVSVDAKKKELVGKFKNNGREWQKKGKPTKVSTYDFRSDAEGVAIPYGTYDIARNEGFVNIGISHNTAEFAVNSIEQWWERIGKKQYPNAGKLLICADGGGSNGSKNRLWKSCLQKFATKKGVSVYVCHYPPGASKWNKIEHRMFSYISMNWRGKPLETYETVVSLIANTTTTKGLKIKAKVDPKKYKKGIKISDEDFGALKLHFDKLFPKWNYRLEPDI